MAAAVKKLDVHIGDVVEIGARRYDVVSDSLSGVALEPVITQTVAEVQDELGLRPSSARQFDEQFGDLPVDGEGQGLVAEGRSMPILFSIRVSERTRPEDVGRHASSSRQRRTTERERTSIEGRDIRRSALRDCEAEGRGGAKFSELAKALPTDR